MKSGSDIEYISFGAADAERACALTIQQAAVNRTPFRRNSDDSTPLEVAGFRSSRGSAFRNRVLFLEAGLQILEVYRNAGL